MRGGAILLCPQGQWGSQGTGLSCVHCFEASSWHQGQLHSAAQASCEVWSCTFHLLQAVRGGQSYISLALKPLGPTHIHCPGKGWGDPCEGLEHQHGSAWPQMAGMSHVIGGNMSHRHCNRLLTPDQTWPSVAAQTGASWWAQLAAQATHNLPAYLVGLWVSTPLAYRHVGGHLPSFLFFFF